MSNIQENSIITILNDPECIKTVLDASLWAAQSLETPLGLLYSSPAPHTKKAIDYSGCLIPDNDEDILQNFASNEYLTNLAHKSEGKELLSQAQAYCKEHSCQQEVYPLHRQSSIAESVVYVEDKAKLIIMADKITCSTSLPKIIRSCHCPILIAHNPFQIPNSALLAFDNKEASQRAIEWLIDTPMFRTMKIHVVMVAEDNEHNSDALREAYAKLTQAGIKCKKKLIPLQDVATAILTYQQEQNLEMLISGAFGQSRIREWLQGSDTQKLLVEHYSSYLLFPKK